MEPIFFTTKSGKKAEIRQLKASDAEQMLQFINTISLEDTFIRYSGEQLTISDEQKYIDSEIEKNAQGDAIKLLCFVDGQLAGTCDVHRDTAFLKRKRHQGIFGLVVASAYRGEGIGKKLLLSTIQAAWQKIPGLLQIQLECFGTNSIALQLYRSCGFVEVGRVPRAILHRGAYIDEIIMVLSSPTVGGEVH